MNTLNTRLLTGLQQIIDTGLDLPLVPIGNHKQPLGDSWQNRPFTASQLIEAINSGGVEVSLQGAIKKIPLYGFGIITGLPVVIDDVTYYLMALDQDGASAIELIQKFSNGKGVPDTVAFSSGRVGRCQYLLLVPQKYKDLIRTQKIKTGVIGDDGKPEQLEFRWASLQSVLPPSVHPMTGHYHWVEGKALGEIKIEIISPWILSQMLINPNSLEAKILQVLHDYDIPLKLDKEGKELHGEVLAAINEKVDIVELVQQYIPLLKQGKNYLSRCPFHKGNTKSFTVSREKQHFSCYECGTSGKAVNFLYLLGNYSLEDLILVPNQTQAVRNNQPELINKQPEKKTKETINNNQPTGNNHRRTGTNSQNYRQWTARDWALSYLQALSAFRADDYDDWLAVGMALHSVDDSLLLDWDNWSRQSSKYKPGDCEKKWKSFKPNGGVTLGTLAHLAKQDGWQSPFSNHQELNSAPLAEVNQKIEENPQLSEDNTEPGGLLDGEQTRIAISQVIEQGLTKADLTATLNDIKTCSIMDIRQIWQMYYEVLEDAEVLIHAENINSELRQQIDLMRLSLNITRYIPGTLGREIHLLGRLIGSNDAGLLFSFLTVAATLIRHTARLAIRPRTEHYVAPLLFVLLVGSSSSAKTPSQKLFTKALWEFQTKAEQEYQEEMQTYEKAMQKWEQSKNKENNPPPEKPTSPRTYIGTDVTTEAAAEIQVKQRNTGWLLWADELSGLINSANQYRRGRGSDAEKLLMARDGTGFAVYRASGKRLVVDKSCFSILGGTVTEEFQGLKGGTQDHTGHWPRFLKVFMPDTEEEIGQEDYNWEYDESAITLQSKIIEVLSRLIQQNITGTHRFSPQACKLYLDWRKSLTKLKKTEGNPYLKSFINKLKHTTGELILVLYRLRCAITGEMPQMEIDETTTLLGIELAEFCLSQEYLLINQQMAVEGDISAIQREFISWAKDLGIVTARIVKQKASGVLKVLKEQTVDQIRAFFKQLHRLGMGELVGQGNRLAWRYQEPTSTVDTVATTVDKKQHNPVMSIYQRVETATVSQSVEKTVEASNPYPLRTSDNFTPTVDSHISFESNVSYPDESKEKTVDDFKPDALEDPWMENSISPFLEKTVADFKLDTLEDPWMENSISPSIEKTVADFKLDTLEEPGQENSISPSLEKTVADFKLDTLEEPGQENSIFPSLEKTVADFKLDTLEDTGQENTVSPSLASTVSEHKAQSFTETSIDTVEDLSTVLSTVEGSNSGHKDSVEPNQPILSSITTPSTPGQNDKSEPSVTSLSSATIDNPNIQSSERIGHYQVLEAKSKYLMVKIFTSLVRSIPFNWSNVIQTIDTEIERLGWSVEQIQQYIKAKYGVTSLLKLNDEQIMELLHFLIEQDPIKVDGNLVYLSPARRPPIDPS